ncbi:hypothetical protein O181_000752 [Austropuccinia psidii MF-1]|uniref:Uncharacterized protein n=1 Tax=Austropuccinia psidii MF-1 TaxID=1389203 RepID=A0A9Q3GCD0_9BASI|nr:hypothetical protein [Austropuccinia psidii MF-1]
MEYPRSCISSQGSYSTFYNLIESPEVHTTAIPVVRSYQFLTSISKDIPVSVQELVYFCKAERVGASTQLLYRYNELLPSIKELLWPRKDKRTSEGLETHVLQGTGPKDKIFVETEKHFVRGSEEIVGPKEQQQPCGSFTSLNKFKRQARMPQRATRRKSKR